MCCILHGLIVDRTAPLPHQLDNVRYVEVDIEGRHDLSLLQVFQLLAVQVLRRAEVRAEVCQVDQHDVGLGAVVVVDRIYVDAFGAFAGAL